MRTILDTGVFFQPEALEALRRLKTSVVVPAVAYAERIRQLAHRPGAQEGFRDFLREAGWVVEPFAADHADRIIAHLGHLDQARWERLARDAMIAGHVEPGDRLITTNAQDFVTLGVAPEQVVELPSP